MISRRLRERARDRGAARRREEIRAVVCAEIQEHETAGSHYGDTSGSIAGWMDQPRLIGFQADSVARATGSM